MAFARGGHYSPQLVRSSPSEASSMLIRSRRCIHWDESMNSDKSGTYRRARGVRPNLNIDVCVFQRRVSLWHLFSRRTGLPTKAAHSLKPMDKVSSCNRWELAFLSLADHPFLSTYAWLRIFAGVLPPFSNILISKRCYRLLLLVDLSPIGASRAFRALSSPLFSRSFFSSCWGFGPRSLGPQVSVSRELRHPLPQDAKLVDAL